MHSTRSKISVASSALCCWLASAGCGSAAQAPAPASKPATSQTPATGTTGAGTDAVATVNGEPVSRATLDQAVAPQIAKLDEEAYQIRKLQLNDMIDTRLLASEATRRGVTVDALVAAEVTAKVVTVTDADVAKFVADNRTHLPPDPATVMPQIRAYIASDRATTRRAAFVSELRTSAKVEVLLKMPAMYRASIDLTGAPSRGPGQAGVTIVEFSDFHCPFCRRVQPTLQQVLEKYPTQVRLVYKHFPIDNLHPQARRAAEASWCAQQQHRFWEFHDAVYANSPDASDATLATLAAKSGLDMKVFDACVASGKASPVVQAHIDEGTHYGVNGTPGFFVNGRFLSGAVPLGSFSAIIDEELANANASH